MQVKYLDLKKINARLEPRLSRKMKEVIASGYYLHGQELMQFERDFSEFVGSRHCVGVGNGLDALTLILTAMCRLYKWDAGDEVVVPSMTFVATAEAVRRAGLRPVFCDVREEDFLLHADDVRPLVTSRTRAVIPVHLYGRACDMDAFSILGEDCNLKIVEDAAQAHGAYCGDKRVGTLGHAAAFSFYPGKNLGALGDGGAVTTDDSSLAAWVRRLANYGSSRKYYHEISGINSRLDELQAAVLVHKLKMLDEDNHRRREIAAAYSQRIQNPYCRTPYAGDTCASVFHIYPLLSPYRDALREYLAISGIDTLIHYPIPVHKQPAFSDCPAVRHPISEKVATQEISLPISPVQTDEETRYVIQTLNHFKP